MQVWKTTGRKPAELDTPSLPEAAAYLWQWYLELRTSDALTFTEIKAWSDLTGKRIRAWEVDVLRRLDMTYWKVANDG